MSRTVAAVADTTTVRFTPSAVTGAHEAGVPYAITLPGGQTYQLRHTHGASIDLSGTLTHAYRPVALFGSHRCANVRALDAFFCDGLVEQLVPIKRSDTRYYTFPPATCSGGDTVRAPAVQDGPQVRVNGTVAAMLDHGEFREALLTGCISVFLQDRRRWGKELHPAVAACASFQIEQGFIPLLGPELPGSPGAALHLPTSRYHRSGPTSSHARHPALSCIRCRGSFRKTIPRAALWACGPTDSPARNSAAAVEHGTRRAGLRTGVANARAVLLIIMLRANRTLQKSDVPRPTNQQEVLDAAWPRAYASGGALRLDARDTPLARRFGQRACRRLAQLRGSAQRTAFTSEMLSPTLHLRWVVALSEKRIGTAVDPVCKGVSS